MRRIILALFILSPLCAFAELKSVDEFYKESESLFKKASAEKTFKEKTKHLLDLEKSFKKSLEAAEKENPHEASSKEKEVSLLFSTLEPVFDLAHQKKLKTDDCEKKAQSIRAGDSMGRDEGAPRSKSAQEALRWIENICK